MESRAPASLLDAAARAMSHTDCKLDPNHTATAKKAYAKKAASMATATAVPKRAAKATAMASLKPVDRGPLTPMKNAFSSSALIAHLASTAASVAKKGAGPFTLPGLLKITAAQVPAKVARFGIDPCISRTRGALGALVHFGAGAFDA
jgi:hypothetical protein